MNKIIDVEISKLKDTFDIRGNVLNQDHVLYLWLLIDAGKELPPIKITKDFSIIEGRHRVAAYKDAGKAIIRAELIDTDSTIEIIKLALSSNVGGPLPPSPTDITRTIALLIKKKYSKERIINELKTIFPVSIIRSAHNKAMWQINRLKTNETIDLITMSNLTIQKACEITGANEPRVKIALGKRKEIPNGKPQTKGTITKIFTHFNKSLGKIISKVFQDLEDGELTKLEAEAIFKFLGNRIINQSRMYADWQNRWQYKK